MVTSIWSNCRKLQELKLGAQNMFSSLAVYNDSTRTKLPPSIPSSAVPGPEPKRGYHDDLA